MSRITAITASKRHASKVVIHVDGRAAATLSRRQAEALGLDIDSSWTGELAAKVADAVAFEAALDQAMRMINRRRLSRTAITARLRERGHDAAMIERVAAKLLAIGAIDDEALARDLLEEIDRTRPAGPALKKAKLAQRGVGEEVIDKIVAPTQAAQLADARRLIASKARAMARLDEPTRKRRLWGLLARRGFDEEIIESLLGAID